MSRNPKQTPTVTTEPAGRTKEPEAPTAPAPREVATGPPRLAYRLDDLAEALGISRRTIERERSAGRFPRPDLSVGKMPMWTPETIRRWIEGGGHR